MTSEHRWWLKSRTKRGTWNPKVETSEVQTPVLTLGGKHPFHRKEVESGTHLNRFLVLVVSDKLETPLLETKNIN